LKILFPPRSFRELGEVAARCARPLEHGKISEYSHAVFAAYWSDDRDISRDDELTAIVRTVGLDPAEFSRRSAAKYKTGSAKTRGMHASRRLRLADDVRRGFDVLR